MCGGFTREPPFTREQSLGMALRWDPFRGSGRKGHYDYATWLHRVPISTNNARLRADRCTRGSVCAGIHIICRVHVLP